MLLFIADGAFHVGSSGGSKPAFDRIVGRMFVFGFSAFANKGSGDAPAELAIGIGGVDVVSTKMAAFAKIALVHLDGGFQAL